MTDQSENADTGLPALLRLRTGFRDPEIEAAYQTDQMARSLPVIRLGLGLGALLYGLFGALDAIVTDGATLWKVLAIRYALVMPVLLGALALTYTRAFAAWAQPILASTLLASGLGVIAMTVVMEPPVAYMYSAGLIMCVIYCSTLIRLRPRNGLLVSLLLLAAYIPATVWAHDAPSWVVATNIFYLTMSLAVGLFSSNAIEYLMRERYARNHDLVAEKARAEQLRSNAEKANAAKSEFLATMSHELRTPLNAIIGFSEMIKSEMLGPVGVPQYREYAGSVYDSGHHLLEIISDILDITKAEAGTLEICEDELELNRLIERVGMMVRGQADKKGIAFHAPAPSEEIRLLADPRLLRQALINLCTNAIKFTRAGEVRIAVSIDPTGAPRISVSDTGIGISPENQEAIFKPFTQVDGAYCRENGGVGLGLALVERIMHLHDGTVALSSAPGAGSTFTLTLPSGRLLADYALQEAV